MQDLRDHGRCRQKGRRAQCALSESSCAQWPCQFHVADSRPPPSAAHHTAAATHMAATQSSRGTPHTSEIRSPPSTPRRAPGLNAPAAISSCCRSGAEERAGHTSRPPASLPPCARVVPQRVPSCRYEHTGISLFAPSTGRHAGTPHHSHHAIHGTAREGRACRRKRASAAAHATPIVVVVGLRRPKSAHSTVAIASLRRHDALVALSSPSEAVESGPTCAPLLARLLLPPRRTPPPVE